MEPAAALADLTEISSQVRDAVLLAADGAVLAATAAEEARAERLAASARELLAAAEAVPTSSGRTLVQVEVALREGSVFVVREGDVALAATTGPDPTAGLVAYDLRTCLHAVASAPPEPPRPPRRRRPRKTVDA